MAGGVTIKEAAVEMVMGEEWDGSSVTFSTGASVLAILKDINITKRIGVVDTSGAGSDVKERYTKKSGTMTIRTVVLPAGYTFQGTSETPEGYWVQIKTKAKSSLSTFNTWAGVITSWQWSGTDGEPQAENVEISLNADVDA